MTLDDNDNSGYKYLKIPLICANLSYKGMGYKMIEALVDIAKECGCKYIELESVKNSVGFYLKMGFKTTNKRAGLDLTSMQYEILSDEEFKQTSKYKKAYLEPGSFGGNKK